MQDYTCKLVAVIDEYAANIIHWNKIVIYKTDKYADFGSQFNGKKV